MAKYLVTYYECYSKGYEVEASSKEEAQEMVMNGILEGDLDGPDNCYDSGYEVEDLEKEMDEDVER